MNIEMRTLLMDKLFENSCVLAGRDGLTRSVKRISVFDCPCVPSSLEHKIFCEGDLFITCLEQFRDEVDDQALRFYLECQIQSGAAGLLVVTDDRIDLLTPGLLKMCDESRFPVVLIPEDY